MDGKGDKEGPSCISQLLSWVGPRTVVVPRSDQGFGFTLRHFVVYPPESAGRSTLLQQDVDPNHWQSKGYQGLEPLDTIFVKTVREGSTAHLAGLTAGDRIVAVNGEPVSGKCYADVIKLIHSSHHSLKLLVVPRDEDILQMAYQSQSGDSLSNSSASLVDSSLAEMQDSKPSTLHKTALQLAVSVPGSHCAVGQSGFATQSPHHGSLSTRLGSDTDRGRREDARMWREDFGRMRSTALRDDTFSRRTSQMREGVGRPVSQDSGLRLTGSVPSKAKYSFGLYFPPRHSATSQSRATSADNLTHSIPIIAERGFHTGSDSSSSSSLQDSGSLSSKDMELLNKPGTKTPSPRHSYLQTVSPGRESRCYVPVLAQPSRSPEISSFDIDARARSSGDRSQRASLGSSVIVTNQSAADRSHRTSLGSSLSRSEVAEGGNQGHTTFVVRIPMSGSSQHNYGSSFAVTRSPRHAAIDVQRQPSLIQVQAGSVNPTPHIVEVQRGSPGPVDSSSGGTSGNARSVWQRKVLFENGQNENNVTGGSKARNRHHTELEKLTSQRKFTSVATRMASFEKSSDEDGEETPGRENTPPSQPQHAVKVRRVSVERYVGPDEGSVQTGITDSYASVEPKQELFGKNQPISIPGTGPVHIFVSPSSGSLPSPPLVEIIPVSKDSQDVNQPISKNIQPMQPVSVQPSQPQLQPVQVVQPTVRDSSPLASESSGYLISTQRPVAIHEHCLTSDVDWQLHSQEEGYGVKYLRSIETGLNARAQRKSSFLSAVNASSVRCSLTPSPEHDELDLVEHEASPTFGLSQRVPPTSVMSASDSAVDFSHPSLPLSSGSSAISISSVDTLPVVLRKKSEGTVEDSMAKLHRRTSYLMATARDRSNNLASNREATTFSPYSLTIAEEPVITPSIVEATERNRGGDQLQPESPLPDITREGLLWCKTAMSDGKKCSDRSWKQVWAVLRGHALFLIKDRGEGTAPPPFSFEEPPISIKSCLVDIAHDYSRKRKHVFRLTTYSESVYLFQAEDKGTMMSWIQAIKTNNNPDHDEEGIGSAELIRRKASTQSESGFLQASPQTVHQEKDKEKEKEKEKAKKLAGISFKGKFPHSPSVRRKKPEETSVKKSWKGRIMPRSFKKQTTDEQTLLEEAEDISKCTFGIPLEDCFPSPNNEYVPLIVELCTRIVEVRGLDIVGVYRVPGNSVAVSHMQEELNRGIENMNMDNDKWLDVNVVSSLLKAFFRKLPQPLVTPDLYDSFIEANRNPNPEKRMLKLKRLLHTLPDHHYETFKHLAEHLSTVAAHGYANKMDAKNLAIMFGPTLIRKVEDDTTSLVTDMSDQCRIIESIILHNDWFFSNWTQDHYVPTDPADHTQPSALDTRVARDDDEDADSAINTKEIISSIVNAANKKLKLRQQNKSTDSLEYGTEFSQHSGDTISTTTVITQSQLQDGVDGRYQETSVSGTTVMTKPQSSVSSFSLSASEDCLDSRTTAPLATSEPDFLDWEERIHYAGRGRHGVDDALLNRSDEVVGGFVARETLDWLKRLEQEARTIRRLEEQRQRDMERRRRQQQIIEFELQRSQRDLEMEESQSVEDILAHTTTSPVSASWTHSTAHAPTDTKSDSALLLRDRSEGTKPTGVASQLVDYRGQQTGGGKYFVSVANTHHDPSFLVRQSSLENLAEASAASQYSHTGSLENIADAPSKEVQCLAGGHGRNSGGIRHGSLDSMLDMIGHDQQGGGSSDSEDGSDLLTSLTTTFDQKLQILLNPKYRLSSRHARLPHSHSRQSGVPSGAESARSTHKEETGMTQDRGRTREPGFRDPSLHRPAKSDTKVGIASRFEWGTTASPSPASSSLAADPNRQKPLPDFRSFLTRTPCKEGKSGNIVLTQPRKLACEQSESLASSPGRSSLVRPHETSHTSKGGQMRSDFRPISKSEKMEVNTALARLSQKEAGSIKEERMHRPDANSRPVSGGPMESGCQKTSGSGQQLGTVEGSESSVVLPGSPLDVLGVTTVDENRARRAKSGSKRRHTVGGTGDLEHFKALLAVSGQQPEPRPSAWDQLCPVQKDSSTSPPRGRSLLDWMHKERLRGSTPDLFNCGQTPKQFSS